MNGPTAEHSEEQRGTQGACDTASYWAGLWGPGQTEAVWLSSENKKGENNHK